MHGGVQVDCALLVTCTVDRPKIAVPRMKARLREGSICLETRLLGYNFTFTPSLVGGGESDRRSVGSSRRRP